MKPKVLRVVSVVLVLLFLISVSATGMSSLNYLLNWFTPLSSSGGDASNSASYSANITIGQTITGLSSSPNYRAWTGYWSGTDDPYHVYVPVVKK